MGGIQAGAEGQPRSEVGLCSPASSSMFSWCYINPSFLSHYTSSSKSSAHPQSILSASSEHCLSTSNCSYLGMALQRGKHPSLSHIPVLGGESRIMSPSHKGRPQCPAAFASLDPAPMLMSMSPLCSWLSCNEHPPVRPSVHPSIPGCWAHFLGDPTRVFL